MNIFDVLYYIERHDLRVYKMDVFSEHFRSREAVRYNRRNGHIVCHDVLSVVHDFWPSGNSSWGKMWEDLQEYAFEIIAKLLTTMRNNSYSENEVRWFCKYTELDPKTENFKAFNKKFIDAFHDHWIESRKKYPDEEIQKAEAKLAYIRELPSEERFEEFLRISNEPDKGEAGAALNYLSEARRAKKTVSIQSVTIYSWNYSKEILTHEILES